MLLEVRWETKCKFLVSRKILRFLSIFKKSQFLSPLKNLTPRASRGVKRCEAPCPDEAANQGFLQGLHRGFRHPFILIDERRACIQATSEKSNLISTQGISASTLLEAAKSGSLSHTYWSGKAPLEVLVESLAYLLSRILRISFLLETIRDEQSFPRVPVLKFVFL